MSEEQESSLQGVLKGFEGAPAQEQIEQWKAQHGEVFVSGFSPEELFVWRPLSRGEYIALQDSAHKGEMNQFQIEEHICDLCVLWKSDKKSWQAGKGGTPQTLSEQIMTNSNFLSPAAASTLVAKL